MLRKKKIHHLIGHISTYENGGYLNWSYDKKENDNKFDINKLKATLSYKVTVASLDPENGNRTTVGEGFIGYEYSIRLIRIAMAFILLAMIHMVREAAYGIVMWTANYAMH